MMYVRVKRQKNTIFLHVEPSDTFAALKSKLAEVYSVPPSTCGLFIYKDVDGAPKEVELMDLSTIGDQEIQNDAVLLLALKKDGSDAYEKVDVDKFSAPGDEAK